jgi:16S rRNA (guanine966-N2)-methyltransferase
VLDLFAGTGALGLEALSRGAARVPPLSMTARPPCALLRANIEKMQAMGVTDVWRRDATRLGPNRGAPYTLVFLDPPYGKGLGEAALASAIEGRWLAPGAVIVWEEGTPPVPPAGFTQLDQRKYGDTTVTLLKAPATHDLIQRAARRRYLASRQTAPIRPRLDHASGCRHHR